MDVDSFEISDAHGRVMGVCWCGTKETFRGKCDEGKALLHEENSRNYEAKGGG